MIASIFHIPLTELRSDVQGVALMYAQLRALGFEWVADENEWLNYSARDPRSVEVMTFVMGSPTHAVEIAAITLTDALENMGYKVVSTDLISDDRDPLNRLVRIEVIK